MPSSLDLPSCPPAVRWARIAVLVLAAAMPALSLGFGLLDGGLLVPSPRKLLILVLVVHQLRALFVVPGPRVITVSAFGGAFQLAFAGAMGLLAMHFLFAPELGMQYWPHPPVTLFLGQQVPWAEMSLLNPGDFMQAPLLALGIQALDFAILMAIGGIGFDVVLDGQRQRVVHGWWRRSVPFSSVRGLALEAVTVRVARGSATLPHVVLRLVDGSRIVLPNIVAADASTLEAVARATGLAVLPSRA